MIQRSVNVAAKLHYQKRGIFSSFYAAILTVLALVVLSWLTSWLQNGCHSSRHHLQRRKTLIAEVGPSISIDAWGNHTIKILSRMFHPIGLIYTAMPKCVNGKRKNSTVFDLGWLEFTLELGIGEFVWGKNRQIDGWLKTEGYIFCLAETFVFNRQTGNHICIVCVHCICFVYVCVCV